MLSILLASFVPGDLPITVSGVLCHPSQLMVKVAKPAAAVALIKSGYRIVRQMPEIGWVTVEIPYGSHFDSMARIERLAGVATVELDRAARLAYDPNDAMWPDMWHMRAIRADLAWDSSFGSSSAIVAIIDTGVKVTHPDLSGNVWINSGEIPGNGIDDDGNGYVDDVNGYDFAYGDPDPNDIHGHGTACAGLAAAVQDNTIGVTGVAPRARIMALKAAIDSGYFYDSANVPAYLYAAANGAKVVSCSFYSDQVSQSERDAIDYIWSQGVLPVVAAGNDNTVWSYYPAAYEHSLAVGALNNSMAKASFSDFGSWVDVAAPGTSLRTTSVGSSGYTSSFGGTSGACPHVAGLAALLFGTNPLATAQQVRDAIEDTASPTIQAPFGEWTNYGTVRADDALAALANPAPPRPAVVRYMTPLQASPLDPVPPTGYHQTRIYGRGFQFPRTVEVRFGGTPAQILDQTRDWVDVVMPTGTAPVTVFVDGQQIAEIIRPPTKGKIHPFIEAATDGATLTGGFDEALRVDGVSIVVTRRSDGTIRMEGTFRRLPGIPRGTFNLRRRYVGGTAGNESLYLYNWSTGSLPYGTFTRMSGGPVTEDWKNFRLKLPRASNHRDPEGTVYFLLEATDVPAGTKLEVDQIYIAEI